METSSIVIHQYPPGISGYNRRRYYYRRLKQAGLSDSGAKAVTMDIIALVNHIDKKRRGPKPNYYEQLPDGAQYWADVKRR